MWKKKGVELLLSEKDITSPHLVMSIHLSMGRYAYFSIPINIFEKIKSCTKFPFPPHRTVRPLFTFLKCLLECPGKFFIIAPKVPLLCFKIRQKFALRNRPYLFRISVMRLENF